RYAQAASCLVNMAALFSQDRFNITLLHLDQSETGVAYTHVRRAGAIESEVPRQENRLIRQQNGAFQHVAQLPDIARPRMFAESVLRFGGQLERAAANIRRKSLEKISSQQRNVFRPFSQGRYGEWNGINSEVEVASKSLFPHCEGKVEMRCRDKVNIDSTVIDVAHSADSFLFKALQ